MKSKTNRRVKRVKKTRRNRRSRRTQRGGGGKFGESIKLYQSRRQTCTKKCDTDTDNPDPMKTYTEKNPTSNNWYLTAGAGTLGSNMGSYVINNKSNNIKIAPESHDYQLYKQYEQYLDMLEELPDPAKIYTTGRLFKKTWKLIYNTATGLFQWVNQKDNTIIHPFVIGSPLNIGDEMATQST